MIAASLIVAAAFLGVILLGLVVWILVRSAQDQKKSERWKRR